MLEINKTHIGHALDLFKPIEDESIDMVCTSPPYWSLRDYSLPPQIWDSVDGCEHEWKQEITKRPNSSGGKASESNPYAKMLVAKGKDNYSEYTDYNDRTTKSDFCIHCNAWQGNLGLEPTFQLYIQHLMQIFTEINRVLSKTGTCFVNIGDSYASGKGTCFNPGGGNNALEDKKKKQGVYPLSRGNESNLDEMGIRAKSLYLIPERFIIMMVDDLGFIARNVIIWHKPNPMPESCNDRFTRSFEYVYLFSKSQKYYFEQQFEPRQGETHSRGAKRTPPIESAGIGHKDWCKYMTKDEEYNERNKRNVWTIPTKGFSEAHFATFPEKLIIPMILAGCPKEICNKCGKAREKIYKGTSQEAFNIRVRDVKEGRIKHTDRIASKTEVENYQEGTTHAGEGRKFVGYTDCGCNAGFHPGVVLDPFIGSGTVGKVALAYGRNYIGFDLGYEGMSKKRTSEVQLEAFNYLP